jgi:hypothetical protein
VQCGLAFSPIAPFNAITVKPLRLPPECSSTYHWPSILAFATRQSLTKCYKIKRLLECLLQDWVAFENIEDFVSPFPRFGNQHAWAVTVSLQYLNALLRNPTVEVFILVICSSRAHKGFRQLHVVVSKLHGPLGHLAAATSIG